MANCPIWQEECLVECPSNEEGLKGGVCNCLRAGGIFECANTMSLFPRLNDEEKILTSGWIAHENFIGESIPLVDEITLQRVISRPMPAVSERLNLALKWLIVQSGVRFGIRPLDYSEGGESFGVRIARLMAFAYCHIDDWTGVLSSLEQEGLIKMSSKTYQLPLEGEGTTVTRKNYERLLVTPKGFAHHAESGKIIDSSRVFVAMWFGEEMNGVYDEAMAPAIRAAGYEPVRVDREDHIGKIDDEIIAQIRRARFIIADFTAADKEKPRGGVYYEAGFAYGLGREVIYTCRADFVEALHFDTRQFNHLTWEIDKLPDFCKALRFRIERNIGQGEKRRTTLHNSAFLRADPLEKGGAARGDSISKGENQV